jgi:hypothetical protein
MELKVTKSEEALLRSVMLHLLQSSNKKPIVSNFRSGMLTKALMI